MKKKKGISLIVLVITIIVIIVLATAVIVTIVTNNPIKEANKARYESDRDNMQAVFTNTVAKVMANNQGNVKIKSGQLNNQTTGVDKVIGQVSYTVENASDRNNTNGEIVFDKGENTDTKYYTGMQLPIYKAGETKWYVDHEGIVTLEVNGVTYGNGKTINSLKAGEKAILQKNQFVDFDGNVATIPIDFIVVPGCENIANGLVISDDENDTEIDKKLDGSGIVANGNQFVWIPVNDMSKFVREEGYVDNKLQTILKNTSEPLNYNGVVASQEEQRIYHNMIESVTNYHGFYMGRYEVSNDGNEKPESKKNKAPWQFVSFAASYDMNVLTGGILEKIRNVYPEGSASKGKIISILPFGVQWDETVRFIKKNYPGIEKDSIGYGNYRTGNIISTGSNVKYAQNNIYDMFGNVGEWTMECYNENHRVRRGASYSNNNTNSYENTMTTRSTGNPVGTNNNIGARIALYISL